MSSDVGIDDWLKARGYGIAEARTAARAALEAAGLTRPGKQRLSNEKLERAAAVLSENFYLHCQGTECTAAAAHSGKTSLLCEPKSTCQSCGGSDNQRAVSDFVLAFGKGKLCIVGGSPSVWEELQRLFGDRVQLRLVDGTLRRTVDHAKADLEWADLILLWGATELHHKVSMQYTNAAPPLKKKVVHVAKRGIAQLLAGGLEHLRRARP